MLETDNIFYGQPVDWKSPLNRGLISWYLAVPWWKGGIRWIDLCNLAHGTLTDMNPASDWVNGPPDSFGALKFNGINGKVHFNKQLITTDSFTIVSDVFLNTSNEANGAPVFYQGAGTNHLSLVLGEYSEGVFFYCGGGWYFSGFAWFYYSTMAFFSWRI